MGEKRGETHNAGGDQIIHSWIIKLGATNNYIGGAMQKVDHTTIIPFHLSAEYMSLLEFVIVLVELSYTWFGNQDIIKLIWCQVS